MQVCHGGRLAAEAAAASAKVCDPCGDPRVLYKQLFALTMSTGHSMIARVIQLMHCSSSWSCQHLYMILIRHSNRSQPQQYIQPTDCSFFTNLRNVHARKGMQCVRKQANHTHMIHIGVPHEIM